MTWLGQNAPAFHGEMRWAAWNDESTRSAGMAVIRMAAVAISPASACLVSALSVDSAMVQVSIGMVATFWASRESLPFSIAIFSGGLDVLGDNDLFVLMC